VQACPKDVNPMGQIMRLRRIAGSDQHITDRNNGERHEAALSTLVRDYGLLHEAELPPRSYGGNSWFGKFHPAAGKELLSLLPTAVKAIARGKISVKTAMFGHKLASRDLKAVQAIYEKVEGRPQRYELNLYVTGYDEDDEPVPAGVTGAATIAPGGGEMGSATQTDGSPAPSDGEGSATA
jgi:succinate dehydrogenase / fumarate reductase iron-sulfur subunit